MKYAKTAPIIASTAKANISYAAFQNLNMEELYKHSSLQICLFNFALSLGEHLMKFLLMFVATFLVYTQAYGYKGNKRDE